MIKKIVFISAWLYVFGCIKSWSFDPAEFGTFTRSIIGIVILGCAACFIMDKISGGVDDE